MRVDPYDLRNNTVVVPPTKVLHTVYGKTDIGELLRNERSILG
jgi:hypothetical protein